jgi:hypothetical protein
MELFKDYVFFGDFHQKLKFKSLILAQNERLQYALHMQVERLSFFGLRSKRVSIR